MDPAHLRRLLDAVARGDVAVDAAVETLRDLPFADLGDSRIDHHRELRTGEPEVVFGEHKTPQACADAVASLLRGSDGPVLVTRASAAQAAAVRERSPSCSYDEVARVVVARAAAETLAGAVTVVTAGTSDQPVARECEVVLEAFGVKATSVRDVGVAGIHRLLAVRDELRRADVIVAVAGMEGALPSAIGGLVAAPVIAVPTSVGYGASFDGLAALLGMLTSCAPGVAVVNIDNGFGAAMVARRILGARATTEAAGT